jgi:hypothetical protein
MQTGYSTGSLAEAPRPPKGGATDQLDGRFECNDRAEHSVHFFWRVIACVVAAVKDDAACFDDLGYLGEKLPVGQQALFAGSLHGDMPRSDLR